MSRLVGGDALRARLKAAGLVFKPYGKRWADATADEMRHSDSWQDNTGRLRKSFRRRNATAKKATVVGHYTSNFVDAGSKAHDIVPRKGQFLIFDYKGQTIFAKRVHKQRIAAKPFKARAARRALERHPMSDELIAQWNRAA